MGGSSKSDTHQVQSNTINPMQMQQYQDNYANAQSVASGLTPYTGQVTAGFNDNQTQAQGLLSGIATDPRYAATTQQAINTTQGLLGANPNTAVSAQNVTASPYSASQISAPKPYDAAQLAGTDLSPYTNPFQKNVIDASISQNQYARDQQGVSDNAAATAAGAFGGSRQGVQRAETTAGYDRNNQQNIAALNSANFTQAQNAAGTDIAARNAASQFNSNMAYNTGAFNSGATNAASQFNAGQNLNAQQFNSGQNLSAQQSSIQNALAQAGYKLNAAGQLQSLNASDLAQNTQQAGILSAVGDTQQAQQQKELSDAWNLYTQGQQLSLTQQQLLNQALGIIPLEQTNTTDGTTTTKSNPGIGGILGGVASLGLAAATGGSSMGLTGLLGGLGGAASGGINGMFSTGGTFGPKYTGNGNGEF